MGLILASSSPYRGQLLARLGIPFRVVNPDVDERSFGHPGIGALELAEGLARAKAESVSAGHPESVVIGGDQVVGFEGRLIGKPGTMDRAREQLLSMAGKEHTLVTSIAIADGRGVEVHTEVARLRLRPLDPDEVDRYLAADRPLDCAGSYRIEGLGVSLFDRIDAADSTSIVGLPLLATARMLRDRGFRVP